MTKQRDFKTLVRQRMAKTGERYAAARAQVLAQSSAKPSTSGTIRGGGMQGDVGALRNALDALGLTEPNGDPLTEATTFGLCGGVGFLYGVFEYAGHPPTMTVIARSNSMPGPFLSEALKVLDAPVEVCETGGAKTAAKQLDEAIAASKRVLCHVDVAGLPYHGASPMMAGAGPAVVGVLGFEDDGATVLVDDRSAVPMRVARADFDAARAMNKAAKHRLVRFDGRFDRPLDPATIGQAIDRFVVAYDESPAKSFASNIGTAGLGKWARLLTDQKDKKGWPTIFKDGALAYLGLRRAYDGLEHEYTAPAGGRPLMAQFLRSAGETLGDRTLETAADLFDESGRRFATLTSAIAEAPDEALRRGCAISDEIARRIDEADDSDPRALADATSALQRERRELGAQCALDAAAAREVFGELAAPLGEIVEIELDALTRLRGR